MTQHRPLILTLALLTITLTVPTALAQGGPGGDFDSSNPINQYMLGDAARICTDADSTANEGVIQFTWVADPVNIESGPSHPSDLPSIFSPGIEMPVDDAGCVTVTNALNRSSSSIGLQDGAFVDEQDWDLVDPCFCLNETGRWSVRYVPASLGSGNFVYINFTVVDPALGPTYNNDTTTTTASFVGPTTETTIDILDKVFWIGFAVLFLMNRWMISGTFFIAAAIFREATSFAVTDATLYTLGASFILIEWLVYTRLPEIHDRIRNGFKPATQEA